MERLASFWPNRKAMAVLVPILIITLGTPLGYYMMSYYSVSRVSVDIASATRSVGSEVNYTIQIRVSVPGAILPVRLWPATVTLFVDSYLLGGVFPCFAPPDDFWNHVNPGSSFTCTGYWRSTLALEKNATAVLSQTRTNHLVLWVYFHQAESGWYSEEMVRQISTTRTWT